MIGQVANIYKNGVLAATLERTQSSTIFRYVDEYSGQAIGTGLEPGREIVLAGAAIPAWFANLLPEGRRLGMLRRWVKTSADDDFSLLLAVGADPVGDVSILPGGASVHTLTAASVPSSAPFAMPEPSCTQLPPLLDEVSVRELIRDDYIDHKSLPGVQDKLSHGMITLPVLTQGREAILKINPPDFPHAVENEAYMLTLAKKLGLPVANHKLVQDGSGETFLLVERFDRELISFPSAEATARAARADNYVKYAVEDGCQVLEIYPADKYNIEAVDLVEKMAEKCQARLLAARNMYFQFLFAWFTGNGDLHAKNLSVLQQGSGEWRMAPIYDVPTTLPYADRTMALSIMGRRDGFSRRHLLNFGQEIGLPKPACEKVLKKVMTVTADLADSISAEVLPFSKRANRDMARVLKFRQKAAQ